MALVEKLELEELKRKVSHKPVRCSATVVQSDDGTHYLQLDTYGSSTRKIKGKKSQSLRLSKKAIAQLLDIARTAGLITGK